MSYENAGHNPYRSASYSISAHRLSQLPGDTGIEIAFAGRSNAGKSSAINALTEQKSLARTSKTPGRTQQIVVFDIGTDRRIADLPGYGYAKVPAKLRAHWQHVLQRYFATRQCLRGVVLVMDIRHPLRPFDRQMIEWCRLSGISCHVLLTKSDKLKRGAAKTVLLQVDQQLPEGATAQLFSASKGQGRQQLIARLNEWFELATEVADSPDPPAKDKIQSRNTGTRP